MFLQSLRRRALEQSISAYLVGGPVRDVLLDAPVKDLDFVVEGDAPVVACALSDELGGEVLVHGRFGTATVALGESHIDVVTARRETYPHPGALPQVEAGTIHDDLARRDFSINALAIPLREERPQIIDLQGGVNDLAAGLVRILHPRSFIDDPTRILRAVRYEQRFGFALEADTLTRLREALSDGYIHAVSGDRLRHELERILEEEYPFPPMRRAMDLRVLAAIHPSLVDAGSLGRLVAGRSAAGHPHHEADPLIYLAALVYPLSSGDGEALVQRLNLPGWWARVVRDTIELRRREPQLAADSLAPSRIYGLVHGLSGPAVAAVACLTDSNVVARRLEQYTSELAQVRPVLKGQDLMELGVPEGPQVGEILGQLQEARLDQKISSEEDERRMVRDILNGKGGQ